jgi:hypothetical protein
MNDGLNFWHGILLFLLIAGLLGVIGAFLGAAAIRLSVRDDYFEDPDAL